jgi:hypothetical protein
MKTPGIALIAGLLLATTLGACSAGAAPSPTPSAAPTGEPSPTAAPPTQVPGGSGSGDPNAGVVSGGVGGVDPNGSGPKFVLPKPGTQDPHPVSVETLRVELDGRQAIVVATWWSGVEPCYQLDTAAVKRDGNDFTIALTEGHGGGDVACIEIALEKATAIDLGELEPGEYTVTAQDGTAEPVTFTVS